MNSMKIAVTAIQAIAEDLIDEHGLADMYVNDMEEKVLLEDLVFAYLEYRAEALPDEDELVGAYEYVQGRVDNGLLTPVD